MTEVERHQIDRLKRYINNDPAGVTKLIDDYESKLIAREFRKDGTKTLGEVWLSERRGSLLLRHYYSALDEIINTEISRRRDLGYV